MIWITSEKEVLPGALVPELGRGILKPIAGHLGTLVRPKGAAAAKEINLLPPIPSIDFNEDTDDPVGGHFKPQVE